MRRVCRYGQYMDAICMRLALQSILHNNATNQSRGFIRILNTKISQTYPPFYATFYSLFFIYLHSPCKEREYLSYASPENQARLPTCGKSHLNKSGQVQLPEVSVCHRGWRTDNTLAQKHARQDLVRKKKRPCTNPQYCVSVNLCLW